MWDVFKHHDVEVLIKSIRSGQGFSPPAPPRQDAPSDFLKSRSSVLGQVDLDKRSVQRHHVLSLHTGASISHCFSSLWLLTIQA